MTGRRDFLKVAGGAGVFRLKARTARVAHAVLEQARDIVRSGELGQVGYCRVEHSGLLAPATYILDEEARRCMVEVDLAAEGAVFLGTRATLLLTSRGFRLFTPDARSAA